MYIISLDPYFILPDKGYLLPRKWVYHYTILLNSLRRRLIIRFSRREM